MIKDPVIIIGCARSGTTLLFNVLSEAASLWSIGYESKALLERYHHPSRKGWISGALEAEDLTPESEAYLLNAFAAQAAPGTFWRGVNRWRARVRRAGWIRGVKRHGTTSGPGAAASSGLPQQGLDAIRGFVKWRNRLLPRSPEKPIRLLEKTPENCLRLPFLLKLFPDAKIIYMVRDGQANVSSLLEGWRHPYLFKSYELPEVQSIGGRPGNHWSFTLVPGWRDLLTLSLEEICAWQWVRCNEAVLEAMDRTKNAGVFHQVRYETLVARPEQTLKEIAAFLELDYKRDLGQFAGRLPEINVLSSPGSEKWRTRNPEKIERILPLIRPMMDRLGYRGQSGSKTEAD